MAKLTVKEPQPRAPELKIGVLVKHINSKSDNEIGLVLKRYYSDQWEIAWLNISYLVSYPSSSLIVLPEGKQVTLEQTF